MLLPFAHNNLYVPMQYFAEFLAHQIADDKIAIILVWPVVLRLFYVIFRVPLIVRLYYPFNSEYFK